MSSGDSTERSLRQKARSAQKEAIEARKEADALQSELASVTMKNEELTLKHESTTKILNGVEALLADERVEHKTSMKKTKAEFDRELGKRDEEYEKLLTDLDERESKLTLLKTAISEESRKASIVVEEKYEEKIKVLEANFRRERKDSASRRSILMKELTERHVQELRDLKKSSSMKLEEARKVARNAVDRRSELSRIIKLGNQDLYGLRQEVQRLKSSHSTIERKRCQELDYLQREVHNLNSKLQIQHQRQSREAQTPVPSNNKPYELHVSTSARSKQAIPRPTVLKEKTVTHILPPPGFGAAHSSRNRKQAPSSLPSPQQAKRAKLETDQSPPSAQQDQIRNILNNVSPSNVGEKARDLEKLLSDDHRKWFANYFLSNFVMHQPNNHKVYSKLIRKAAKLGAQSLQTSVETVSCDNVNALLGSNETRRNTGSISTDLKKVKAMGSWYAYFSRTTNSLTTFCEIILIGGMQNGEIDTRARFVEAVLSVVCEESPNKFDSFSKTLELLKTIHDLPSTADRTKIRIEAAVKNMGKEIGDISAVAVN